MEILCRQQLYGDSTLIDIDRNFIQNVVTKTAVGAIIKLVLRSLMPISH
jgi:hypothetical protein